MENTEYSDVQLIQAILKPGKRNEYRDGDLPSAEEAFELLYARYNAIFAKILFPYCRYDTDLVNDSLQEGWSEIVQSLTRFDQDRPFFSWATVIFLRASKKVMRKTGESKGEGNLSEYAMETLADKSMVDDDSEERDMLNTLYRSLKKLSDSDYTILYLKYFEKKKIEEIMEVTGLSRSAVFYRLERSRKKLRKEVERDWGSI